MFFGFEFNFFLLRESVGIWPARVKQQGMAQIPGRCPASMTVFMRV
jgi:hypothetical protein